MSGASILLFVLSRPTRPLAMANAPNEQWIRYLVEEAGGEEVMAVVNTATNTHTHTHTQLKTGF